MDLMDRSEGKIDPTFFSTCRLCVSKPGSYQILPQIQKQIKEFFDISVHAYDGLPQLLCEECRSVITYIHATRTTFQTKQKELISRNRVLNTSEDVEGNAKYPEDEVVNKEPLKGSLPEVEKPSARIAAPLPKPKSDRNFALPIKTSYESQITSSDSVSCPTSEGKAELKLQLKLPARSRWVKWYACRFCDQKFRQVTSLNDHLQTHSALVETQSEFNIRHCFVSLLRCGPPKDKPGRAQKLADESVCTAPNVQVENVFGNYFIRKQRCLTDESCELSCGGRLRPQRNYYYDPDPDELFKPEKKRKVAKILRAANKAAVESEPKEKMEKPVDRISGTAVTDKNTVEAERKIMENVNIEECGPTIDDAPILENSSCNESVRSSVDVSEKQNVCSNNNNIIPALETEKELQRSFLKCIPTASLLMNQAPAFASIPPPFSIVRMRLKCQGLLLTDDLKTIFSLKDSRALAIYDLYLTANSPKMVITLFVCLHSSNLFYIEAVDVRGRFSISKEPPVHQLKILQSLLKSYVVSTIRSMAIKASQDVHDNTMRFLAAIEHVLKNIIGIYRH